MAGKQDFLKLALRETVRMTLPTKCDISNLSSGGLLNALDALQFQRWIVSEQYLRSVLNSPTTGIDKFLNEYLAKDSISFLSEHCAENDRYTIVAGLDIDGFLFAVVDCFDLSTFADSLRRFFGSKFGSLLSQLVVLLVCLLEWGSHGVALQQRKFQGQCVSFLYVHVSEYDLAKNGTIRVSRTFCRWQVFQVNQDREVVSGFHGVNIVTVLALQHLLSSIFDEIWVAPYLKRDEDLRLGFGKGRNVKGYAIEVGDSLVNRRRRGSGG